MKSSILPSCREQIRSTETVTETATEKGERRCKESDSERKIWSLLGKKIERIRSKGERERESRD